MPEFKHLLGTVLDFISSYPCGIHAESVSGLNSPPPGQVLDRLGNARCNYLPAVAGSLGKPPPPPPPPPPRGGCGGGGGGNPGGGGGGGGFLAGSAALKQKEAGLLELAVHWPAIHAGPPQAHLGAATRRSAQAFHSQAHSRMRTSQHKGRRPNRAVPLVGCSVYSPAQEQRHTDQHECLTICPPPQRFSQPDRSLWTYLSLGCSDGPTMDP